MTRKLAAIILGISMMVAAGIGGYRLCNIRLESSVLSLLPQTSNDADQKKLEQEFIQRLNSQVIFAVGQDGSKAASDSQALYQAADIITQGLKQSPYIRKVLSKISDEEQLETAAFFYKYITAFLNDELKQELKGKGYGQKILAQLYASFSGISSAEITSDLLLVGRKLGTSLSRDNALRVEDHHLVAYDEHNAKWVLIIATLADDPLSTSVAAEFTKYTDALTDRIRAENPALRIIKKGAIFYSDYAASTSQREVTILGLITIIGIFCLIYFIYRSLVPVFLTIGSVICGLTFALCFTTLLYHEINLIIIGMCISVIGIVCDYTIYFTTLRIGAQESSFATIRKLTRPLSFAVITDLCAYLIILLSPVQAVSQMAFFCMCTISFACLFVILVEPWFLKSVKRERLPFASFFRSYLSFIRRPKIASAVITLLCSCSLFAFYNLKTNDDPFSFQKMPEELKSQERKINELLKTSENLKYILISAKNDDALLIKNEKIREKLTNAVSEGKLKKYLAVKINAETIQQENCAFLNERKASIESELQRKGIGIKAKNYRCAILHPDEFFSSSLGEIYKNLYYRTAENKALMVVLEDVADEAAVKAIVNSVEGSVYLDYHGQLTEVFRMYREIFFKVILIFMGCILLISTIRVGPYKALVGTLFSALSLGTALFTLELAGLPVNLFSELGLIVLLGIGINYNIFMSSSKTEVTSIIAIFTALSTTLMAMGVLIFSSVDAIKCFAVCLVAGIICAFILSALMPHEQHQ